MPKLTLTVGLPASSKSTWAKGEQRAYPDTVLVSKDDLRSMMHIKYSNANERLTVGVEDFIVKSALNSGRDVIVHNTHLNPVHVLRLFQITEFNDCDFEVKSFLDVPLEVCIERNRGRTNSVPEDVIYNMYNKWFDSTGSWIGTKNKEINGLTFS